MFDDTYYILTTSYLYSRQGFPHPVVVIFHSNSTPGQGGYTATSAR